MGLYFDSFCCSFLYETSYFSKLYHLARFVISQRSLFKTMVLIFLDSVLLFLCSGPLVLLFPSDLIYFWFHFQTFLLSMDGCFSELQGTRTISALRNFLLQVSWTHCLLGSKILPVSAAVLKMVHHTFQWVLTGFSGVLFSSLSGTTLLISTLLSIKMDFLWVMFVVCLTGFIEGDSCG